MITGQEQIYCIHVKKSTEAKVGLGYKLISVKVQIFMRFM